ncbi:MAG: Fic family protein [Natronosporangium sp.]
MFAYVYVISPRITNALMEIEAGRQSILELPIDVEVITSLRETARLAATHYSTQIEGNRLTRAQVAEAVAGAHFPGRERDEAEVRNYYRALAEVERLARAPGPVTERDIRRIHGLVQHGRSAPSPYRDGQNVIRDSATDGIVYLPPEAHDVPGLMTELVEWLNRELDSRELPAPVVAAIAHYQFATVHPYYDGNGRTARLLTTLILHKTGYALKGIYSLEEHYVRDLSGYYAALAVGPSHNYYLGRTEAEITGFLDYFCRSMADAVSAVRAQAVRASARDARDASSLLRRLDPRQRRLLELFRDRAVVTTAEIATHLGLSRRTVAAACRQWVDGGFLELHDRSRKGRSYRLAPAYERLVAPGDG